MGSSIEIAKKDPKDRIFPEVLGDCGWVAMSSVLLSVFNKLILCNTMD